MKAIHSVLLCLSTILLPLLYSCHQEAVYDSYQSLPNNEWKKEDTLRFVLPEHLEAVTYKLEIGIRHTCAYRYRDLWLELTQYVPEEGKEAANWKEKKDTLHLYLADKKGNWLGKGSTSSFYQLLVACDSLHLPGTTSCLQSSDEKAADYSSSARGESPKSKKKYTFLGTEKTVGCESRHLLKIAHIMQDSVLTHISDIGIRLTPEQP